MKLTKNFSKIEFDSRDGAEMPTQILDNVKIVAQNLQRVRDYTGLPIHINSGYRSVEHNRRIGGVPNSFHTKGMAADIVIRGKSPLDVFKLMRELMKSGIISKGGLGLYDSFVHYDIRGFEATWDNRKRKWYQRNVA